MSAALRTRYRAWLAAHHVPLYPVLASKGEAIRQVRATHEAPLREHVEAFDAAAREYDATHHPAQGEST